MTSTDTHGLRRKFLMGMGILFWVLLVGRLFFIQIWHGAEYASQARGQHERRKALEAIRGRFLDRNGRELAVNLRSSSFAADPSQVGEPGTISRQISALTGRSQEFLLRALRGRGSFVWLVRKTNPDIAREIRAWRHPGLCEITEIVRWYPFGRLAGQLIGFTNLDNRGIEGTELSFNDELNGRPGWHTVSVDGRGHLLTSEEAPHGIPEHGDDVVLTLDARYQQILEEELEGAVSKFKANSAMGILMHPKTGDILAMANVPLYDPNRFWQCKPEIRKNRTVTDIYEPGSAFKIVTAAAVIERGLMDPDQRIFCENGTLAVAGGEIRDAHEYGWLTLQEVIEHSSNIGTIKAARCAGAKVIHEYARLFGFGAKIGMKLPGEVKGILKHPSFWSGRSLDTISIGHEVSTTALQLAAAYSAVANGGVLMRPRILKSIVRPEGTVTYRGKPETVRRVISERTAHVLVDFLVGVVERGTGKKARIEGLAIAGKTGTAQKVQKDGRGYSDEFISTFVGFLPARDPKLVCLVVLDSPKEIYWSSEVAAPTFRRIVRRILSLKNPPVRFYREARIAEVPGMDAPPSSFTRTFVEAG